MKYLKPITISLAVVAAGAVGFAFLAHSDPARAPSEDARRLPPLVETVVARPATASERGFTGVVSARIQSNLGFRVPGKVTERLVDVGSRVRAGQPLMRIDPKDLALALTSKRNAVTAARAQLVQASADEARYRDLVAGGWSSKQRYEQAKATLDTAQAQVAAAEAQAEVAQNETGYAVLGADADGTVVEILGEPGQVVSAGQVVVKLAHAGAREATVNLPETARPALGSIAQANVYGIGTGRSAARLRQLSDAADPMSRTYEARYVLEGEAALAPLGATVTVWIPRSEGDRQETEIPLGAILDDGTKSGVWIIDASASTVSFRDVQVLRISQEDAVVAGIAIGERIVALGAHLLHPGQPIRMADTKAAIR